VYAGVDAAENASESLTIDYPPLSLPVFLSSFRCYRLMRRGQHSMSSTMCNTNKYSIANRLVSEEFMFHIFTL
jgi:hypothetical protein